MSTKHETPTSNNYKLLVHASLIQYIQIGLAFQARVNTSVIEQVLARAGHRAASQGRVATRRRCMRTPTRTPCAQGARAQWRRARRTRGTVTATAPTAIAPTATVISPTAIAREHFDLRLSHLLHHSRTPSTLRSLRMFRRTDRWCATDGRACRRPFDSTCTAHEALHAEACRACTCSTGSKLCPHRRKVLGALCKAFVCRGCGRGRG